MKKERYIFFLIILFLGIIYSENIKGDYITGEATSQNLNINISIQTNFPYILITSPKNETYLKNTTILLNYIANNYDFLWYSIDNLENITITSPKYINVSQGPHILYLYANNSNGEVTSKVEFTSNSTKFLIQYENFKGMGETTNFEDYTYEEIQNLNNIILENTNYGKIKMLETINLTEDSSPQDNSIDLNNNIEISQNKIKLNYTLLPNFNKKATLWVYNLGFSNPRIIRNNLVCPSSICAIESYSSNTLKFNVTLLGGEYLIEETPISESYSTSKSGGGGEIKTTTKEYSFTLSEDKVNINLKQGEIDEKIITIKNSGKEKISFIIYSQQIEDLVMIKEKNFELNPGEEKEILINIFAKKGLATGMYIGKIIINGGGGEKEILLAISVESKDTLLDLKIEIPKKSKTISQNEKLISEIKIYNPGDAKSADIRIRYSIKDEYGNEVLSESESAILETSSNFIKEFEFVNKLKPGNYILYVEIVSDEKITSASTFFSVKQKREIPWKLILILVLSITILIIVTILINAIIKKWKKSKKNIKLTRFDYDVLNTIKNKLIEKTKKV